MTSAYRSLLLQSGPAAYGQTLLFLMLSRVPNDFERIIWEWPLKL